MPTKEQSVLLISPNLTFTDTVAANFFRNGGDKVHKQNDGFKSMNGHAADLAFGSDVVLFEAVSDNEAELSALSELLQKRTGNTVFLGISDSDMSIGSAQKFREIGVDDILPISITENGLNRAIEEAQKLRRNVLTLVNPVGLASDGAVIAIAQARGGIGATTLAVNLASKLRGEKKTFGKTKFKSVALLDLDLQFGNANVFLDLEDNGALQKMIEDEVIPDEQYVHGMMQTHSSGVDILNAPSALIPLTSINPLAISAMIDALRRNHDYVVIDLPRAIVDWLEPVIEKTTLLQIVMDTSIPSIRHAKRLIDFYQEIQTGLPVELIVNREAKPWPKSARCKEAEQILEIKFSHWLPDDPGPARKAADLGVPVSTNSASAALSKSIAKLAKKTISSSLMNENKTISNKGPF